MRALVFAFWLFSAGAVAAESASSPTALVFNEVPLSTLVTYYYKLYLKQNYVLSKELIGNTTPVTLDLKGIDSAKYPEIFQQVFAQYGVHSDNRGGVWYVSLLAQPRSAFPFMEPTVSVPPPVHSERMRASQSFPDEMSLPDPHKINDLEDSDIQVYRPVGRRASELQIIANKLLGTDLSSPDRVLLKGSTKSLEKVLKLLQDYDEAPATVKVQAYLIEFSDSSSKAANFSLALSALGDKLGLAFGPAAALSNFVRIKDGNINAVISALDGDSRFQLVDSPNTLCDHGEQCRIQVGSENPVLGSLSIDRNGNPQQSVTYRDSGSILEITPEVMRDVIRVKLRQTVSSFAKNSVSGIDSPSVLKRMLDSTISLGDGDIVVLGGLDQSRQDTQQSGLSFLPRFLDTKAETKQSTQLLMVLHIQRLSNNPS